MQSGGELPASIGDVENPTVENERQSAELEAQAAALATLSCTPPQLKLMSSK